MYTYSVGRSGVPPTLQSAMLHPSNDSVIAWAHGLSPASYFQLPAAVQSRTTSLKSSSRE